MITAQVCNRPEKMMVAMSWKRFWRSSLILISMLMPCLATAQIGNERRPIMQTAKGDDDTHNDFALKSPQFKSSTEMTDQFDRIWTLVKDRFYNPNLNGLDWKKI